MSEFTVALFYDDTLRADANARERNYWPVYYHEICSEMGLPYCTIGPECVCPEGLGQFSALLLPPLGEGYFTREQEQALGARVEEGGLLVGFATEGLDWLFGLEPVETIPQLGDEFTPSCSIRMTDTEWMTPLLLRDSHGDAINKPMPVLAPALRVRAPECRELVRLLSVFGEDLRAPAVTYRAAGEGAACWWAFDLAQCLWVMQQGRPGVEDDYDGDGVLKVCDGITTRPWPCDVPYADIMRSALRRILAEHGAAFIHAIPPGPDGSVPDALYHWGGDDCGNTAINLPAAQFMQEVGLPYHVNMEPSPAGDNPVPPEEVRTLLAMGAEVSIQFRLSLSPPGTLYWFGKDDFERQVRAFVADYGFMPKVTVFGRCEWIGWAEPARWLAELGLKGDNNRISMTTPPPNQYDVLEFHFGTVGPFHYWDDWAHGNQRVEFTSQPILAYEVGWHGDRPEAAKLHRAVELAAYWNVPMNMFFHPPNIARYPACREAVRTVLAYIEERGINALHLVSDAMCLWWHTRAASEIEEVSRDGERVEVTTCTDYAAGVVVQMLAPDTDATALAVTVNGAPGTFVVREQHGARWLYLAMPTGQATAEVGW